MNGAVPNRIWYRCAYGESPRGSEVAHRLNSCEMHQLYHSEKIFTMCCVGGRSYAKIEKYAADLSSHNKRIFRERKRCHRFEIICL